VSNAIVAALEQAAKRVGLTLSEDAGRAVSGLYKDAGRGAEDVVRKFETADAVHRKRFIDLLDEVGKEPKDGEKDYLGLGRARASKVQSAKQDAVRSNVTRILDPEHAPAHDYEITVDSRKYPESAQHIQEAQSGTISRGNRQSAGAPKPSVVTIDREGEAANRDESLRGIPTAPGQDRDEYPPAMFEEGGKGASVKHIDSSDNQGSGSSMGTKLRGLPKGTKVKITVK
jgi:hypothetical protein